jgi:hypothetical protein
MKYIVIKDTAILLTRDIEMISSTLPIVVEGVKDGTTITLNNGQDNISATIISESAKISASSLTEGTYMVTIVNTDLKEIQGHPIKFQKNNAGQLGVLPAPLSTATELDLMWKAIGGVLETIVPMIEEIKHGYEVI